MFNQFDKYKYVKCLGSSQIINLFQIFSNSMARGIEFYHDHVKVKSLKNSYETQIFTDRLNKLFDVFNRKYPAEGIRKNSPDFKYVIYLLSIFK